MDKTSGNSIPPTGTNNRSQVTRVFDFVAVQSSHAACSHDGDYVAPSGCCMKVLTSCDIMVSY